MDETCCSVHKSELGCRFKHSGESIGIGGIIRDSDGEVLVSVAVKLSPAQRPEVAEALSLRKMLQICNELELNSVLKGDCSTVVKAATIRAQGS